jgi:AMMECR1 domain-containing protein
VTITDTCAVALIRLARSALADYVGAEADELRPSGPYDAWVNVTVYVHQRLQASMSGRGATLEDAVRRAAARAAVDARFGRPLLPEDLANARLELWVRTASEVIDSDDVARDVDMGLHGVEIRGHGRSAYYKPSVALTRGLVRHQRLLDKLTKKARLTPGAWQDPGTTLHRTTWEHYCEVPDHPDRVLHLRRLRPAALEDLTSATLRARAHLVADRLMRVQSREGYYLYQFHPFTNREMPGPGNLVRQAGCAYAMARAADCTEDPQRRIAFASSSSRAVDALLSRVVVETESLFIVDLPRPGTPIRGKLGTLALTLAAVQSTSLAHRYQSERQRLADAVMSWQRPDGSFRCRTDSTSVTDDATAQNYFPGEALMALAMEVRAGSRDAQRAMAAAFPWYRARFRAQPTTAFVPWQVEAWRLYAEWAMSVEAPMVPDAKVSSEFVFEMAEWILQLQIGSAASHPDLIGGYALPDRRPGCSTATYTQAIIGACSLAQQLADVNRASRYRTASLTGLDFVRRLQLVPATATLFRDPIRAVGGTTASLSNMTIRCDHDQHALTAYLAALETSGLVAA